MNRYANKDKRCNDCIHNKVCNMWAIDSGIPFVNAITCEHYTADVVPKSEVEKTKQEVAREIFEEIDKLLDQWIQLYYTITVGTFDSIEQAKARASESVLRAFRDYAAELKKKYTEGNDNGCT